MRTHSVFQVNLSFCRKTFFFKLRRISTSSWLSCSCLLCHADKEILYIRNFAYTSTRSTFTPQGSVPSSSTVYIKERQIGQKSRFSLQTCTKIFFSQSTIPVRKNIQDRMKIRKARISCHLHEM